MTSGDGGGGKVVAVTGASGYIASWLVKMLLRRGYTVKASVRDPNNPKKTQHLISLDGAKERLHLFAANLLEDGSFDSIVDGCNGVFHTASPVVSSINNPQADVLDPAIKGTLNVLRSCIKVASIKRVVLTSSMAAVIMNKELKVGAFVDESWFSDPAYCEEGKWWYVLSKTLAENAAWEFAKERGIDLVTINPGYVIGPLLQPSINASVEIILNLVNGTAAFPSTYPWVDVRNVADAHILALETESASGRYIMVESSPHSSEIIRILRKLYPTHKFPDETSNSNFLPNFTASKEKVMSLGIEFVPLEVSLRDTVESLKEKNFVNI